MMLNSNSIVVHLLAWQDAVHSPIREFDSPLGSVATSLRLRFRDAGIPYRPRSKDPAEQKADQRELDALAGAGALVLYRGRTGRANAVRLLDAGEEAARELCGLPGIDDSILALREIKALTDAGRAVECRGMRLVSESTIQRVEYGAPGAEESFATLQDFLLPALARGWALSHSTTAGHVFYELTEAGRAILSRSKGPARLDPFTVNRASLAAYDAAFGAARQTLRSMEPIDAQEIGPCPLPPLPIPTRKGVRAPA